MIRFDAGEIRARLRTREVQAYYSQAGIDIESLLGRYLEGPPRATESRTDEPTTDLNHDLFPRDEFSVRRVQK